MPYTLYIWVSSSLDYSKLVAQTTNCRPTLCSKSRKELFRNLALTQDLPGFALLCWHVRLQIASLPGRAAGSYNSLAASCYVTHTCAMLTAGVSQQNDSITVAWNSRETVTLSFARQSCA